MNIVYSPLFQSYLDSHEAVEDDLQEYGNERRNRRVMLGNILFITRYAWIGALIVCVISVLASLIVGWSWTISLSLIALVFAWAAGFIYIMPMFDEAEQPKVLDRAQVSLTEYGSFVRKFCELTGMDRLVVDGLTDGDLRSIAAEKLISLAKVVKGFDPVQMPDSHFHAKARFREAHATMYQLGLVAAHWDRYFQN